MTRLLAALAAAATLAFTAVPASAADRTVKLTLDGRPVDRAGGVAVLHNGVVYANVVPLVKSFDGLLTFQGTAVVVTINGVTGRFTEGSRTALINDGAVTMPGQTFKRDGDLYVPLATFVTQIAKAKLRTNPARTQADIFVNAPAS
ncbi:MAG TPA: stalk domain-containing protein [Candidatus Elarobacter sp.]|nr:stalk domain-containing protein [Candidatus Elarobacter sp.]